MGQGHSQSLIMYKFFISLFEYLNLLHYYWKLLWGVSFIVLVCSFILVSNRLQFPVFPTTYSQVVWSSQNELMSARVASDGQWRFPSQSQVSSKFEKALIEFEDKNFYLHHGVDLKAVARAIYLNIKNKKVTSGASTLSMQIIRMKERAFKRPNQRNLYNKISETLQALQLEIRLSKKEIMALYANHAPLGGNVVGLEAASWRYFGRSQNEMSWAQAALLAILPNNPSQLNLKTNRSQLQAKRNALLERLYHKDILSKEDFDLSVEEEIPYELQSFPDLAEHFIYCQNCPKSALDKELQSQVKTLSTHYMQHLKKNFIYNNAIIILDIKTGLPIVYLGNTPADDSADRTLAKSKHHKNSIQVDMIQAFRSPGSTLKPFLYGSALERGIILPGSLLPDYPSRFGAYRPLNFNQNYRGVVPAWQALARSLNIPAVHLLQQVGVGPFQDDLDKWGLKHMQQDDRYYGLTLALGGAETSLWELSHAYRKLFLTSVNNLSQAKYTPISPQSAQLTLEAMMKVNRPDDERLWQTLGVGTRVAYKTGTSWGFRDAWSLGVTPDYVIGVWIGNASSEGRPGLTGVKVAAPLLFKVLNQLHQKKTSSQWANNDFQSQATTCAHSGYLASSICPSQEVRALPKTNQMKVCPYHVNIQLNLAGERVHSQCKDFNEARDSTIFQLPPKMSHYYQLNQAKKILDWSTQCPIQKTNFQITYPDNHSKIILPKMLNNKTQGIYFDAQHHNEQEVLYWFINGKYLSSTVEIHQIEAYLDVGSHSLSVQDKDGNTQRRKFEVVRK